MSELRELQNPLLEGLPLSERGWRGVRLGAFAQDVNPHTMPDGTVIEPTMDWFSNLTARRSDGIDFYVKVRIENRCWTSCDDAGKLQLLGLEMRKALSALELFRVCACLLGSQCEWHQ